MTRLLLVFDLLIRISRGERFRKATPEELRIYGACLSLGCLIGLILLSVDRDAWTASPAVLWTGAGLSLFPLAVFLFWVEERVRPVWSITVTVSITVLVFVFAFLYPRGSIPASTVARVGLLLLIGLIVAGSASRHAPLIEREDSIG